MEKVDKSCIKDFVANCTMMRAGRGIVVRRMQVPSVTVDEN